MENKPVRDPVCGMLVDTATAKFQADQGGVTHYFCSAGCQAKFLANSLAYVTQTLAPKPAAVGVIYTCPMHPQIRQVGPGSCPICGMTLEPEIPTLETDENPELKDFRRRFFWTLPLTVIVAVLAMAGHGLPWLNATTESWIELALSLPIVLWAGKPFFVRAVQSLIHRSPNMWTLIGLGTSAAFIYSLIATLIPRAFPASFVVMGRVPVYFEAVRGDYLTDLARSAPGIECALPNLRRDQIAVGVGA
jgi:Cu+-exporting ATPase